VPWAACKAKPITRRLRNTRKTIRKAILQFHQWLLDQLGEVEQQQRETVQCIAGAFRR
jgi:hypothetical protein